MQPQPELTATIVGFPVPPSANSLYAWAPTYRRMIKTKKYKEYEREVTKWVMASGSQVKAARQFFHGLNNQVIHIDATFYMRSKEIICLDGKPKKNDTANRLKALHDVLSSMVIGIDDSYFWSGSFSKEVADKPSVSIEFKLRSIQHGSTTGTDRAEAGAERGPEVQGAEGNSGKTSDE